MDQNLINLTGVIGTNVTLIQPWYAGVIGLIGAALFGAIVAGIFTLYRDGQNNKKQKKDDQILAINWLRGVKHTMLQSKASYYSAFFASERLHSTAHMLAIRYIDYDSILHLRKSGIPSKMEEAQQYINKQIDVELRKSLELKEYLRQKQRSEELQQEIAKNDERFWRTIGRIRILFPDDRVEYLVNVIKDADHELGKFEKEILEGINPIRNEIETKPGLIKSNDERGIWTEKIANVLNKWTNTQPPVLESRIEAFDSKIDDLLNHLENELA